LPLARETETELNCVTFVGYQRGFGEDLPEIRVILDDVEILHEDVLDGNVVGWYVIF
jgi:hypothetical protein